MERQDIQSWSRAHQTPDTFRLRGQIVLGADAGYSDSAIAKELEIDRKTVALWRARFLQQGLKALWEVGPGRGRQPRYGPDTIQAIVNAQAQAVEAGQKPLNCRQLAATLGVSKSTVSRMGQQAGLHTSRAAKSRSGRNRGVPSDMIEVLGLYVNPPLHAVVFCWPAERPMPELELDEPETPGQASPNDGLGLELLLLFVKAGRHERERHRGFLKMLRRVNREFPAEVAMHVIVHHPSIEKYPLPPWLQNSRFRFHFITPNCDERAFVLRRSMDRLKAACAKSVFSFSSNTDLFEAIIAFPDRRRLGQVDPHGFLWTATNKSIRRRRAILHASQHTGNWFHARARFGLVKRRARRRRRRS